MKTAVTSAVMKQTIVDHGPRDDVAAENGGFRQLTSAESAVLQPVQYVRRPRVRGRTRHASDTRSPEERRADRKRARRHRMRLRKLRGWH
jgi:hypothetical protein